MTRLCVSCAGGRYAELCFHLVVSLTYNSPPFENEPKQGKTKGLRAHPKSDRFGERWADQTGFKTIKHKGFESKMLLAGGCAVSRLAPCTAELGLRVKFWLEAPPGDQCEC